MHRHVFLLTATCPFLSQSTRNGQIYSGFLETRPQDSLLSAGAFRPITFNGATSASAVCWMPVCGQLKQSDIAIRLDDYQLIFIISHRMKVYLQQGNVVILSLLEITFRSAWFLPGCSTNWPELSRRSSGDRHGKSHYARNPVRSLSQIFDANTTCMTQSPR